MMRRSLVLAMVAFGALEVIAQPAGFDLARGDRFRGWTVAGSVASDAGPRIGVVRDRAIRMGSFYAERVQWAAGALAFSTAVDVPIAMMLPANPASHVQCWWRISSGKEECSFVSRPHDAVYAVGVTPLIAKLYVGADNRARWFGSVGAGGVIFDRKTPVDEARAMNFAIDFGVGVDVALRNGGTVASVAWRYQHWSNAETARLNPGIDANLLVMGLRYRRR